MANKKKGWHKVVIITAAVIAGTILVLFAALSIWSYRAEQSPANDVFHSSAGPDSLSGVFAGKFSREVSWQGKQFNPDGTGINNFKDGQRYPFKTYPAKSLKGDVQVLRIDYNQPENPLWLRFIADEIVYAGEQNEKFQGKVYLKLGPLDFTLTYFELRTLSD